MSKFVLVGRDRIAAMGDPEASPRGDADRPPRADGDENLLAGLRRGDEGAFRKLVDEYGPFLLRLALMHMPSRAVALWSWQPAAPASGRFWYGYFAHASWVSRE